MTQSETQPARANRGGDPCPEWCAADHGDLILTTTSGHEIYAHSHVSNPMTRAAAIAVILTRWSKDEDCHVCLMRGAVMLAGSDELELSQAANLALVVERGMPELAGDLAAAVAIAGEAQ
jgi:hypothetical protein